MITELKRILNDKKATIAVAESLTGGNLQAILSSIDGSSTFFLGGITAYNIDIKNKFFDIDYEKAKECDCVSKEVALAMAKGISELMNSDYSIATTGFAVPNNHVSTPYAYICFFNSKDQEYEIEKVESPFVMSRIDFQKYLVDYSLKYFIAKFGDK